MTFITQKETTYLVFKYFIVDDKSTYDIYVENKNGTYLGKIMWKGAWWKYVYHPVTNIVLDSKCLQEIISTMDDTTKQTKESWKKK